MDVIRTSAGWKLVNLQNVALHAKTDGVWMEVDGRKVGFARRKLTTFGSMVNGRVRLEKLGPEIKFEYDGKSAAARFKGRPMVEFMQVQGDELEIRYAQSKDEKHFYRMKLEGR